MPNPLRTVSVCFAVMAAALAGCQGSGDNKFPAKVSGKVSYNGSPVTGGTITFHTADGSPIQAAIGLDGTYNIVNLPEGPVTVTVETESLNQKTPQYTGQGARKGMYGGRGAGPAAGGAPKGDTKSPMPSEAQSSQPVYVKIPGKYAQASTSGLTTTLKKGDQKFDVTLTD
jgi:hypothetical protein